MASTAHPCIQQVSPEGPSRGLGLGARDTKGDVTDLVSALGECKVHEEKQRGDREEAREQVDMYRWDEGMEGIAWGEDRFRRRVYLLTQSYQGGPYHRVTSKKGQEGSEGVSAMTRAEGKVFQMKGLNVRRPRGGQSWGT